jgi:hypothetical protein
MEGMPQTFLFGMVGLHIWWHWTCDSIYVDVYGIPDEEAAIVFVVWMGLRDFELGYHEAIRERVRKFVEANLPPHIFIRFYRLDSSTW